LVDRPAPPNDAPKSSETTARQRQKRRSGPTGTVVIISIFFFFQEEQHRQRGIQGIPLFQKAFSSLDKEKTIRDF